MTNKINNAENECLPTVSIIIPTLNEEKNISRCLESIVRQDYPKSKLEIILVDGMSSDRTVNFARNYQVRVVFNEKIITGNAHRLGVEAAKGEILAFIDADNELPRKNWLITMVSLLNRSPQAAGVFPLLYVKRSHPAISRCYALLQANPIVTFAYSTGKTTNTNIITEKNYFPIGGNGLLLRRSLVLKVGNFRPFPGQDDVDLTYRLARLGYCFILVTETGIYHLSHSSFSHFLKKTYRRISNFIYFHSVGDFQFIPQNQESNLLKGVLQHATFIVSLVHACKGFYKDKDPAWFYYPIIVFATILTYSLALISNQKGRIALKSLFKSKA